MLKNLIKVNSKINCLKLSQACFSIQTNKFNSNSPRVLITGGLGQLGPGMASILRNKYGRDNVIISDVNKPSDKVIQSGPFLYADILDFKNLQSIIVNNRIDWVIHMSALLSAVGENNVPLAMRLNIEGVHNILELARQYKLRLFIPSTIGSFGPESPRNPTPDVTIQRPKTIYGVSKVHMELLGEYFFHKYKLDFRCLRLPSIISPINTGLGGTAVYSVEIFHHALKTGSYECYFKPDTRIPYMYIDDCINSIVQLMEAPSEDLKLRTYNVAAISFSPEELYNEIKKHIPNFKISYKVDFRQSIAEKWPMVMDDSGARRDWKWSHEYDLPKLVNKMLHELKDVYPKKH